MKLEDIYRYQQWRGDLKIDKDGGYCEFDQVEKLYNYQQDIINSLMSNSESQTETNSVLINRILELEKIIKNESN